jgi:integrase
MKGHVRERGKGNWYAVLEDHDAVTGKRKRKWQRLQAKGKREAETECANLITARSNGTYIAPAKTTVEQFLGRWLDDIKARVSPKTYERYAEIVHKNIVPLLGKLTLTKLGPLDISGAYAKALASGRRPRSTASIDAVGGLSPRTVHHLHRVFKQALQQAVKWQVLHRNPAAAVDPPKVERKAMQTYSIAEMAELMGGFRQTTMFMPLLLAGLCGMRRGEIAALRWRNVDLGSAQLAVSESAEQTRAGLRYKPPKSGRARTVALSATMVEELRAHRLQQAQDLLRVGVRLTDDTFVCTHADGQPLLPMYITQCWARTIAKTRLAHLRFHDLRHTHATHLLKSDVHPKIASERLGHSKVGITLDLYSHVLPGMQEDAAARVDSALREAIGKDTKNIG